MEQSVFFKGWAFFDLDPRLNMRGQAADADFWVYEASSIPALFEANQEVRHRFWFELS
jgi:hypothetical protein